ncbi:hypothetical protein M0R45_010023 [Rubus argutus]|uniref:Uncharacterized protein n=1 Tax=Rubus argutus TaxID=59490 RepID=A0AAW1Y7L8_RUBAR
MDPVVTRILYLWLYIVLSSFCLFMNEIDYSFSFESFNKKRHKPRLEVMVMRWTRASLKEVQRSMGCDGYGCSGTVGSYCHWLRQWCLGIGDTGGVCVSTEEVRLRGDAAYAAVMSAWEFRQQNWTEPVMKSATKRKMVQFNCEWQSTTTHGWTVSCDGLQLIGATVGYVGEAEKLMKAW